MCTKRHALMIKQTLVWLNKDDVVIATPPNQESSRRETIDVAN